MYTSCMQKATNQIIKSIESVKMGQEIGLTYSQSGSVYQKWGIIVGIKGNTIRISFGSYIWPYSFSKCTKSNHVFKLEGDKAKEAIEDFNQKTREVNNKIREVTNQFWTEKIAKAEQEQKEQGTYVNSEVSLIDFKTGELVPQYKTMEISV